MKEKEKEFSEKYTLHFEPGEHPIQESEFKQVERKLLSGDLTAHYWNPEIAIRMRQYSPRLLGIDGESASYEKSEAGISWLGLPGSPIQMSGREAIYIVAGDLSYKSLIQDPNDPMYPEMKLLGHQEENRYKKSFALEIISSTALAIAVTAALARSRKEIPRRSLLKYGLALAQGGLWALNAGRLSPYLQLYSTDSRLESVFQTITTTTRPRFSQSLYVDGRTALLIAKSLDSALALDLPNNTHIAVVMGFFHSYEAGNLLRSTDLRKETISKYAVELSNSIFPVVRKLGYAEDKKEDRQYITDVTLTLLSLVDIYEVKDPGVSYSPNPRETIDKTTTHIKRFQSKEVLEAVKSLGDPKRFYED